jgi:hypothetical protein
VRSGIACARRNECLNTSDGIFPLISRPPFPQPYQTHELTTRRQSTAHLRRPSDRRHDQRRSIGATNIQHIGHRVAKSRRARSREGSRFMLKNKLLSQSPAAYEIYCPKIACLHGCQDVRSRMADRSDLVLQGHTDRHLGLPKPNHFASNASRFF